MWCVCGGQCGRVREELTGAGQPLSVGAELDGGDGLGVSGQRELHSVVWFGRVGLETETSRQSQPALTGLQYLTPEAVYWKRNPRDVTPQTSNTSSTQRRTTKRDHDSVTRLTSSQSPDI